MVYREFVVDLMVLTWNLAYLHEACKSVRESDEKIGVKDKDSILEILKECLPHFETLSSFVGIKEVEKSAKKWIRYFDKKYSKSNFLNWKDAEEFQDDVFEWHNKILDEYSKSTTEILDNIKLLIESEKLCKSLDPKTADDLLDGVGCIGNGLPTPSVMILYRVGESMVKKLYEKQMEKPVPEKHTLGNMIKDLKSNSNIQNDKILDLLDFRKSSRDEAQHPGERYSMKDAEATFMKIRELIEEIQKRL